MNICIFRGTQIFSSNHNAGLSSLGVPGVPWHTQILAYQLTLFQPRGTDYAHLITISTLGFSNLPTALQSNHWVCCIPWEVHRDQNSLRMPGVGCSLHNRSYSCANCSRQVCIGVFLEMAKSTNSMRSIKDRTVVRVWQGRGNS